MLLSELVPEVVKPAAQTVNRGGPPVEFDGRKMSEGSLMSEFLTTKGQEPQEGLAADSMISRVCAYWTSLRENGDIPKRSAIDATALGAALPHVFIAELVTPRMAKLRICGHQIEDLQGLDMRGMPVAALFMNEAREHLGEALAQVSLGARVTLSLRAAGVTAQPEMTATLALLPLSDPAGGITRVMGVLERHGAIGHLPRRFTLASPQQRATQMQRPVAATRPSLRVIQGGKS